MPSSFWSGQQPVGRLSRRALLGAGVAAAAWGSWGCPASALGSTFTALTDPGLRHVAVPWSSTPVLKTLRQMWETALFTKYSANTHVRPKLGVYEFDCSGMTDWVLAHSSPRAAAFTRRGIKHRPLARNYYQRIASVKVDAPRGGWQRVAGVAQLQPGDVIAWVRPPQIASAHTGHVGFVVVAPVPVPGLAGAYLLRFADATSLHHDEDTRAWRENPTRAAPPHPEHTADDSPGTSGLGFGTLLLQADPSTDEPLAYGWVGLKWRSFATQIALGRPMA